MELRHPFDSYIKFWEEISGIRKEKLAAGDAAEALECYFCGEEGAVESDSSDVEDNGSSDVGSDKEYDDEDEEMKFLKNTARPVTVLMLDEIDYLITKKETLVYNYFDWPLRATTARLVVIGISNTMNLPERLCPRVQSRIGGDRCYFSSYNVQDTMTILKSRLGMLDNDNNKGHIVFDEDAINVSVK